MEISKRENGRTASDARPAARSYRNKKRNSLRNRIFRSFSLAVASFDERDGEDQNPLMKVIQAKPLDDFRLHLRFENGQEGKVDLSSWVGQGVFSAWRKPEVFAQVQVTPEGAVAWPGGIDVCPDSLYLKMTGQKAETLFPSLSKPLVHA